jgi:multisubunit Na+/H+ antiporter MnhF subunit
MSDLVLLCFMLFLLIWVVRIINGENYNDGQK